MATAATDSTESESASNKIQVLLEKFYAQVKESPVHTILSHLQEEKLVLDGEPIKGNKRGGMGPYLVLVRSGRHALAAIATAFGNETSVKDARACLISSGGVYVANADSVTVVNHASCGPAFGNGGKALWLDWWSGLWTTSGIDSSPSFIRKGSTEHSSNSTQQNCVQKCVRRREKWPKSSPTWALDVSMSSL